MGMDITKALSLLVDRLRTLSSLFDKVESQWAGQSLDDLAQARLASDMFPLGRQVSAACIQPVQFLDWCEGMEGPTSAPEISTWEEMRETLRATLAKLDAGLAAGLTAPEGKRITLAPFGIYFDLTADRYLDDWILPNLYFHVITAYAILRMKGAEIGKADFLSHLAGDFRPIEPAAAT